MLINESVIKSMAKMASVTSEEYARRVDFQELAKSIAPLSGTLEKEYRPWMNDLTGIIGISSTLNHKKLGMDNEGLQKLAQLEIQTARKLSTQFPVSTVITEASVHITELSGLVTQMNKALNVDDSPVSLILKNYQSVAVHQYKEILRPNANASARLAMLDAISGFVDRQVSWVSDYAERIPKTQMSDEEDAVEEDTSEKEMAEESAVTRIPQHIGYANRRNSEITPSEALEKSQLNRILEMGKRIVELVAQINEVCCGCAKDIMFKPTAKSIMMGMRIGTSVCDGQESFSTIVDNLYFLFYENLERIKTVVTDEEVRNNSLYSCIFAIKDFRTYYRHDFEHGKQNNIKKKSENIRACFMRYCGKMPVKSKDYMKLQYNLYNDILSMEEGLIEVMEESFSVES